MKSRLFGTVCACFFATASNAATITIYENQSSFNAAIGNSVFDDYSAPGYDAGDMSDRPTFDRHTDIHMSNVLGETQYTTTTFTDSNMIKQVPTLLVEAIVLAVMGLSCWILAIRLLLVIAVSLVSDLVSFATLFPKVVP